MPIGSALVQGPAGGVAAIRRIFGESASWADRTSVSMVSAPPGANRSAGTRSGTVPAPSPGGGRHPFRHDRGGWAWRKARPPHRAAGAGRAEAPPRSHEDRPGRAPFPSRSVPQLVGLRRRARRAARRSSSGTTTRPRARAVRRRRPCRRRRRPAPSTSACTSSRSVSMVRASVPWSSKASMVASGRVLTVSGPMSVVDVERVGVGRVLGRRRRPQRPLQLGAAGRPAPPSGDRRRRCGTAGRPAWPGRPRPCPASASASGEPMASRRRSTSVSTRLTKKLATLCTPDRSPSHASRPDR